MSNYFKLAIANSIAIILNLLSLMYLLFNSTKVGLGGFGALIYLCFSFGIYLVAYGIVSYRITKSVIYPNLILLGFVVANSILFCTLMLGSVMLLELTTIIIISMMFSLIPSIITKLIMAIADRRAKPNRLD